MDFAFVDQSVKRRAGDENPPAKPDRSDCPVVYPLADCLLVYARLFRRFVDRVGLRPLTFRLLTHFRLLSSRSAPLAACEIRKTPY